MAETKRRESGYAVGVQMFDWIREQEAVYVDKTEYVWRMVTTKAVNFFLSRPRRFGKSLLVDTLRCYFEGRKELFEGLYIYNKEKEWKKYPVIRFDLSNGKYYEKELVHGTINAIIEQQERKFGITKPQDPTNYDVRLTKLIETAYNQTGEKVVILIDEYDAPMLDSINNPELQDYIRSRVRNLFSPLKAQSQYLRFVFLTGISKFSQLSVFSELNNLQQLTFDPNYEGICGISEQELLTYMKPDIEGLMETLNTDYARYDLHYSYIYAALMAFGADVSAEDQTSDGRMDIALKVADAIYILELKYDKTAEEATDQIIAKDYAVRFAADQRPVYAVGLNISKDRRTIDSYKIVQVKS